MDQITDLILRNLLSTGLQDYGVTDDIMQSEAISNVLAQVADELNKAKSMAITKMNDLQQQQSELQKDVAELVKVDDAFIEASKDKLGPTAVPQQDMNAPEEPAPQNVPPAPDAGIVPPPEMNVPPAPDMGAVPDMNAQSAPDAGMMPPPDMTQISPDMLGAIQPRY